MNTKILVVEDDNSVGNLIKDLLESNNYTVDWAKDGEEGLAKYYSQIYDLLILDVDVPKLNGLELCKKIRQQPFGFITPIIILSVMDTLPDKFKGLCLGADEYLTKPFYVEGILKRIPIVMDYKKEKLLTHTLTKLPSFVKCKEKFTELAGSDYYLVYSDLTDYFKNIENLTQELLDTISKLADILKNNIEEDKLFHLEGTNFCFFIAKKQLKKTLKIIMSDFKKGKNEIFNENQARAYLHLIAFSLKNKKEIAILDLAKQISSLNSKIIRDGHYAVSEKVKVILQM